MKFFKHYLFICSAFAVFILIAAGCGGLKKEFIQKQYYDFELNQIVDRSYSDQGEPLLVKTFEINPAFDFQAFTYRLTRNEYTNDYYNEFIASPAQLITDKTREILYGSTYFSPPINEKKQKITYRLSGKIVSLYGDFTDSSAPFSVLELRFTLDRLTEKEKGQAYEHVFCKTYSEELKLDAALPGSLIRGWSRNLEKILQALVNDLH